MKFRPHPPEEPEINLIPFIDVLLVILIFLMLTTTYSKFTELQVTLPTASADNARDRPKEIVVAVASDGRYAVNKQPLAGNSVEAVANALRAVAAKDSVLIISADAAAPVQAAVTAMDAARRVGLTQITFAAKTGTSP
ncbi:ExbD/TolR family protein [Ottowia testudinis]|uniref:Biopolymer transporter ExbD n=1 Tax=Ottowia testudinis TaxID=2816950 RepID=A0A975CEE2_9BURK|nr:biopolymer transporter ExbD [Ottowia testudinis]QTD44710.1 biopolymer transporter ExbD [Ottowia testudinis]